MFGFPKPEPRKRAKGRKKRTEAQVVQEVRAKTGDRDGDCRLAVEGQPFGDCYGESEWAHLPGHRRSETRGMDPEVRHTTGGSCRFCTKHHQLEESSQIEVEYLTPRKADGPLRYTGKYGRYAGVVYEETE